MKKSKLWLFLSIAVIVTMLLAACGGPPATEEPAAEEPAAEEPAAEEPSGEMPTEVRIAVGVLFVEESWTTALLQSLDRVVEAKPHGLNVVWEVTEEIPFPEGERVFSQLAESGQYDIIWAHSTYSDAIKPLLDKHPDILFEVTGAGNEPLGGNGYWFEASAYEAPYVLGVMAGMMTETNKLGIVGEYPVPNVNGPMHAFADGARSVNPDVEVVATYIESWFDPATAKEAALAQIANGADLIYGIAVGPIEACVEEEVFCFGHYVDQNSVAPDWVISSVEYRWDPHLLTLIDAWYEHEVNGVPYDAPLEDIVYGMAEGGSDIAPFHGLEDDIPQEVIDKATEIRESILSGEFEVPYNPEPFE